MLVESLVLSHLNYALPVWGPALSHDLLARLVKMHNSAIQIIGGMIMFRRQLNCMALCWFLDTASLQCYDVPIL